MQKGYHHLSLEEREGMDMMRREGSSIRQMARVLGRSTSSVSRELKRNSSAIYGCYMDHRAQSRAEMRRSRASHKERLKSDALREYVTVKLKADWSPKQISGRIGIDQPGLSISHEAIYQYVYHHTTLDQEALIGCLRRSHKRRKRKSQAPRKHKSKIINRVGIDERPVEVEARERFGDWEGDTITSRQSKAALLSMVERKSRLVQLEKLENKTSALTSQAVINRLLRFPKDSRHTITFDNGSENTEHEAISEAADIKCFFCDTYSAWQRGTNEHTNGLVRQYLPKKTDFAIISEEEIRLIESRLNSRPIKCLDFKTPLEVANTCVALQC